MPEVPTDEERQPPRTITDGYFEDERHVDAAGAGEFLVSLGEQLRAGDELTVTGEDWELPFAFGEPVDLEIEFDGDGEPELEVEVELSGRIDDEPPEVR